jgi:hypothetical protein
MEGILLMRRLKKNSAEERLQKQAAGRSEPAGNFISNCGGGKGASTFIRRYNNRNGTLRQLLTCWNEYTPVGDERVPLTLKQYPLR